MNNNNDIIRPGISKEYLEQNQITHVTEEEATTRCGCPTEGVIIPYYDIERNPIHDPGERPFCRLRKDSGVAGNKYHQPKGTKIHAYLPAGWRGDGQETEQIAVIEGEFKSLSLTDPNHDHTFPAVGISGFFGFHLGRNEANAGEEFRLTPELAEVLAEYDPARIVFIGDNDTSLNKDFSVAAVRLRAMLPQRQIVLLQINLDEPKGIDDCRQQMGDDFERWFENKLHDTFEFVSGVDITPDELAFVLLESQVAFLKKMPSDVKIRMTDHIIKLLAKTGECARQQMFALLKDPLGIGKTQLQRMVKDQLRKYAEEQKADAEGSIHEAIKKQYFFDGTGYYRRNLDQSYFPLAGRDNMLLHLEEEQKLNGPIARRALYLIQKEQQVTFAGNVAGRPSGLYEAGTDKILVTTSPSPTIARESDCTSLVTFLEEFFGKGVDALWEMQFTTFLGYLHFARSGLKNPDAALQGQVLALLGPAGIGKTLVQEMIITPMLGDRQADPSDLFLGRTNFNDDLIGSEHLCLSDGVVDTDPKIRDQFRGRLKQQVANPTKAWTKKYAGRAHVKPVQRMTMSANLNASGCSVIPNLDDDIHDKLTLLRCYRPEGLPPAEEEVRSRFITMIQDSLPGLAFRVDHFKVPEVREDKRFGIASFHHPDILKLANQNDPVRTLAALLATFLKENQNFPGGRAVLWWNKLQTRFGEEFTNIAGESQKLGRLFSELKSVQDWSDRIDNSKKEAYGDQRNFGTVWLIK